MKIILLQDIKGLGKRGEVKEVAEGYFRNFLQPKKLAVLQNDPQATKVLVEQRTKMSIEQAEIEAAKALAASLSGRRIELRAKVQGQKLFGAIRENDVAQALNIEKKRIRMEPIKTVGEHTIVLKLDHGQSATVTVVVTSS